MDDIKSTCIKIEITLTSLTKAQYSTYSNYLESLQASGNLKSLTFDTFTYKIVEHEKVFRKNTSDYTLDTLCINQKDKNVSHDSFCGEIIHRDCSRRKFKGRGGYN